MTTTGEIKTAPAFSFRTRRRQARLRMILSYLVLAPASLLFLFPLFFSFVINAST